MKIVGFELREDGVYDTVTNSFTYKLGERSALMHGLPKNDKFLMKSSEHGLYRQIRDRIRKKHEAETGESFSTYQPNDVFKRFRSL